MGVAMAHVHYLFFHDPLRREARADGVIRYMQDGIFRKGVAL